MLYQLKVTQLKLPALLLSDASGQSAWLPQHLQQQVYIHASYRLLIAQSIIR